VKNHDGLIGGHDGDEETLSIMPFARVALATFVVEGLLWRR
jgi:hypothetical protein